MNVEYRLRFYIFIFILFSSVFSGYNIKFGNFFLQSILMSLIVVSNVDILTKTIRRLISKHYIVIWFLISAFILSSCTALDLFLHLKESIRFFIVLSVCAILSFYANLFPTKLAKLLSLTIFSISILSFLAYIGVNFYPIVGERFGFPRPFLFANPITISILLGASLCYIYSQYKPRFAGFFSFLGLLSFWSYTGLVLYFIVRHKIALTLIVFIISIFLLFSFEVGSFYIRASLIVNAIESLYYLDYEYMLFGVGLRNLELWNMSRNHLLMTTDITFFVRVIYEFGLFGFVSLLLVVARILVRDITLGLVLIFIFLSIDQVAHFWILPFVILISKDKIFNSSNVGFLVGQPVRYS